LCSENEHSEYEYNVENSTAKGYNDRSELSIKGVVVLKIGLIGLPMTGKTLFFNLLTGNKADPKDIQKSREDAVIGIAKVPDARIDYLSGMYQPKKTTYATIEVVDLRGITPGGTTGSKFLEAVRKVDLLVNVAAVFRSDAEGEEGNKAVDALVSDIAAIDSELLLADLSMVEGRLERVHSGKGSRTVKKSDSSDTLNEAAALNKCRECLENGKTIGSSGLSDEERDSLKSFDFLTERPMIILLNLNEDQFRTLHRQDPSSWIRKLKSAVEKYAAASGTPVIETCAGTELEISRLEEEDRKLFMDDLGIKETGIGRLAATAYDHLGLISFFTVGEDEVRAWPIKKGINARSAAGKIHSDIEKGFIRAEVVGYSDLLNLGTMAKVRENGLFRLEGRDYCIKDGDIINFRFNV